MGTVDSAYLHFLAFCAISVLFLNVFISFLFSALSVAQTVKNLPTMRAATQVRSLGQEDPLEKGTATHSSILAWRIPWTQLQSMGSQRVGHN